MGELADRIASVWRDYATAGVPASGEHEPVKAEIRALGPVIETAISAAGAAIKRYATKALLDADTDEVDGQLAYVYADATDANNAVYQWNDGGNAWEVADWYFNAVAGVVEPLFGPLVSDHGDLFQPAVSDAYLRRLVRNLYVEGGLPGHVYIVNYETIFFAGLPLYRVRLRVRDATLGVDVCEWTYQRDFDFAGDLPPTVNFTQGALGGGYIGIRATAWVDWAAIEWTHNLTTYATAEDSGVCPDRVLSQDDLDRFLERAEPKRILTVGAGAETATHFNSVYDAWASLIRPDIALPPLRSEAYLSDTCSLSNQVVIEVIDDGYTEEIAATTTIAGEQSVIVFPPGLTLRLRGDSRIFMDAGPNTAPVLECPFSMRIEQPPGTGGVEQLGPGYAIHIDNNNGLSKRSENAAAGDHLYHRIRSVVACTVRTGAAHTGADDAWVIGCGISNGQTIKLDGARVIREAGDEAFLGVHNSPGMTDPAFIVVRNSYLNDADFVGSDGALQLLGTAASAFPISVEVSNSELSEIATGGPAEFIARGRIDPTIAVTGAGLGQ